MKKNGNWNIKNWGLSHYGSLENIKSKVKDCCKLFIPQNQFMVDRVVKITGSKCLFFFFGD